jgi:hypothetical protein
MDIMLKDFDSEFSSYIKDWLEKNSDKYTDMDEIECMMPEIYEEWLNSPQEFLSGKKPSSYFMDFEARDLVGLMIRYEVKKVGVPDPLLDAIVSKKSDSLSYLGEIIFDENFLPEGVDCVALQIASLNLINEIDPSQYIARYIECVSERNIDEGVAESMVDSIKQNAKAHKDALVHALETTAGESVKKRFLDILVSLSFDQRVFDELISMFKSSDEKALFASYLGKYGHKDALKTLRSALDWININYLDYIEIRNAIEELGEEVTHARNFEGDKYFESMKGLNDG